jgi:hypothetical protein
MGMLVGSRATSKVNGPGESQPWVRALSSDAGIARSDKTIVLVLRDFVTPGQNLAKKPHLR